MTALTCCISIVASPPCGSSSFPAYRGSALVKTHTRTHARTHTRRRLRMRAAHLCSGLLAPMLSLILRCKTVVRCRCHSLFQNQNLRQIRFYLTWSAPSGQSVTSYSLSALPGWLGRGNFVLDGLGWKKINQRTYYSCTTTARWLSILKCN